MQEYYKNGTRGPIKEFDSIDELFPELEKSLKNKNVKFINIWILPGRKGKKSKLL